MSKIQVKQSAPRGRPRLGKEVLIKRMVCVDAESIEAGTRLGAGSFSRGVREAIRLATEAEKVEL